MRYTNLPTPFQEESPNPVIVSVRSTCESSVDRDSINLWRPESRFSPMVETFDIADLLRDPIFSNIDFEVLTPPLVPDEQPMVSNGPAASADNFPGLSLAPPSAPFEGSSVTFVPESNLSFTPEFETRSSQKENVHEDDHQAQVPEDNEHPNKVARIDPSPSVLCLPPAEFRTLLKQQENQLTDSDIVALRKDRRRALNRSYQQRSRSKKAALLADADHARAAREEYAGEVRKLVNSYFGNAQSALVTSFMKDLDRLDEQYTTSS